MYIFRRCMSYLIPGSYQVPEGHVLLAERYGKFNGVLEAGYNFTNPFTSSVKDLTGWGKDANKGGQFIELAQQQLETEQSECKTKDNVTIIASATIFWKILDPQKAAYEIDILPKSLKDVCIKGLRSHVSRFVYQELFSKRQEISQNITHELEERVASWGIKLLSVEVGELKTNVELEKAITQKRIALEVRETELIRMETAALAVIKQAENERQKKKIETEAEVEHLQIKTQSELAAMEAKAKAQANVIAIESQAHLAAYQRKKEAKIAYTKSLRDQLGDAVAVQMLMAESANKSFKALGANSATKVMLLPNDMHGLLHTVLGLDEAKTVPFSSSSSSLTSSGGALPPALPPRT